MPFYHRLYKYKNCIRLNWIKLSPQCQVIPATVTPHCSADKVTKGHRLCCGCCHVFALCHPWKWVFAPTANAKEAGDLSDYVRWSSCTIQANLISVNSIMLQCLFMMKLFLQTNKQTTKATCWTVQLNNMPALWLTVTQKGSESNQCFNWEKKNVDLPEKSCGG